jgi:sigma-B regulation protein RsbU (phosphoserine phosphatase)
VESPGAGGVALGMFDKSTYSTYLARIERGDVFVLYSDGITEAENRSGRPFDESGLETIINNEAARDPEAIGRAVLAAVEAHAGDARLADDLTALVLKRSA